LAIARWRGWKHVESTVKTPIFSPREREDFSALLDDTSPAVQAGLVAYFGSRPEAAAEFLVGLAAGTDRVLAWHARRLLAELRLADPVAEFRGFIHSLSYELETGSVLLARVVLPAADAGACALELDRLAARCRELIAEPASARERCRVINRVLFHEAGFRGNTEHYEDPLNSFLPVVLERRLGLPITLSIVYLLVARRVGLELEPVALPGHFLVGCFAEGAPFFVDAFDHGAFRTAGELKLHLRARGFEAAESDFAPTPVREVLARCCRNLGAHYGAGGEAARARLFEGFVAAFESAYERPTA
jgi:regulator of sirC expression with transglutaminase-like and TPR domain